MSSSSCQPGGRPGKPASFMRIVSLSFSSGENDGERDGRWVAVSIKPGVGLEVLIFIETIILTAMLGQFRAMMDVCVNQDISNCLIVISPFNTVSKHHVLYRFPQKLPRIRFSNDFRAKCQLQTLLEGSGSM